MPKEESERATGIEGVIERAKESAKADNIQGFIDYVQEHGGPKLNAQAVAIAVRGYKYYQAANRGAGTAKKATAKKATAKKATAKKATAKRTAKKRTAKKSATKRVGKPQTEETPQADAAF